jgi:2-oxoisovalerate dehydrogenase E1 component
MSRNIYDRAHFVDRNFTDFVDAFDRVPSRRLLAHEHVRPPSTLTGAELLELFESQIVSRHLDLISRALRARDASFYTIGSSGHEGNAVLGRLTRPTDPAFLHYRSGGFMVERSRRKPEADTVYDILLALVASADDPVAGGRHKVWGSVDLWAIPQTSTIASHLPKAVGMAIGIRRALKVGVTPPVPRDSIVVCSFGDASVNHSTALGAISAAARSVYQQVACPILFVCEDNGLGISVNTPRGWIEDAFGPRPGVKYFRANGLDIVDMHRVTAEAVNACRTQARPVFLHMKCARLMGHAGSDVELEYRTLPEVEATEALDPVLATARIVLESGLLTPGEVTELYESVRSRVEAAAERAIARPRLTDRDTIMAPLAPHTPAAVQAEAMRTMPAEVRLRAFGEESKLPERIGPKTMGVNINHALADLMCKHPESILFGEDVARKGGVYHVTANLLRRFGPSRVFDTILDEQTILGVAQGFGYCGLLPFPEIQYLAYFHNACDQIRGEACSTQFFSNGQFRNPMVLRIAALGYQKGFGGHFHNDNSIAALRDIPGLIIACPSRGDDAAAMLRTCAALARIDGNVVAFLEPIALYHRKDLHETKDGGWLFPYPPPEVAVPLGEARVYHEEATALAIITYGNGVLLSLEAARVLAEEDGVSARIVDLRWLNPLNTELIAEHAAACGHVVVVDEGRRTGGISEAILTAIVERCDRPVAVRRVVGEDTYIPLGPAANLVLPSVGDVVEAAREVLTLR